MKIVIRPKTQPDLDYDFAGLGCEISPERKQSYGYTWTYISVQAEAEIHIPYGQDYIVTTLCSPGLYGVESDSDADYLFSVYADEVKIIKEMLTQLQRLPIGYEIQRGML